MKKIGLYFGSFNPIHIGHLIIAEYFVSQTDIEEVWMVVSPHNPLKQADSLAPEDHRLAMVRLALENNTRISACDIEFSLTRPSYTANTLRALSERFPNFDFSLIIGEDCKTSFHLWKDYLWILENYRVNFFPRFTDTRSEGSVHWSEFNVVQPAAPRIEISSTYVRHNFELGLSNKYLLPDVVLEYIRTNKIYPGS